MKAIRVFLAVCAAVLLSLPAVAEDVPPRLGADFLVNATIFGSQSTPDVARTANGDFVAIWLGAGIQGRFFHASGVPAGGEFTLFPDSNVRLQPHVAATPDGRFAVVWADAQNVYLRRFDRQAHPLGDPVRVSPQTFETHRDPDVAMDAAGNVTVVWVMDKMLGDVILLRRFGPDGAPLGDAFQVNEAFAFTLKTPHVAVNEAGSSLVSWEESSSATVWARLDGPRGAWAPQVQLTPQGNDFQAATSPVLYPEGDGAVAFLEFPGFSAAADVLVQRLDAAGALLGAPVKVSGGAHRFDSPSVAVDAAGQAFVAWSTAPRFVGLDLIAGSVFGRLFDRAWNPLGESEPVSTPTQLPDRQPAVAALGPGSFATVWSNGDHDPPQVFFFPTPQRNGRDGSSFGVFGQVLGSQRCLAGADVLCLGPGGRFEVRVSWKDFAGQTGGGHSVPLTGDTGALWFFQPENLELMIKVLDARALDGHFWIFYGALSNVEYTITVTDTKTGREKRYQNPAGQFASRSDLSTFADEGKSASEPSRSPLPQPAAATAGCAASEESLCFAQGRFQVQVDFTDPNTGISGHGKVLPLTADTGVVWFFQPENLELMIKVLDGRPVNGHIWVFFGALSDVAYTITVTDTETSKQRTYRNEHGRLASRGDVEAF